MSGPPEEIGIPPISENDRSPSPPYENRIPYKISGADHGGSDLAMTGMMSDISPSVRDDRRPLDDRPDSTSLRIVSKPRSDNTPSASPAMPPGASHPTFHAITNGHTYRRSRPQTSHQKAVDINRKMRVDHILHQQLILEHEAIRDRKSRRGTSFGYSAMKRIQDLPGDYDSEDDRMNGTGGLVPNPGEDEEYGEDALRLKKALERAIRRLVRDDHGGTLNGFIQGHHKRKRKVEGSGVDENQSEPFSKKRGIYDGRQRRQGTNRRGGRSAGGPRTSQVLGSDTKREEGLDDLDLDLLGESRDDGNPDEDMDEDSGADDSENNEDDLSE